MQKKAPQNWRLITKKTMARFFSLFSHPLAECRKQEFR